MKKIIFLAVLASNFLFAQDDKQEPNFYIIQGIPVEGTNPCTKGEPLCKNEHRIIVLPNKGWDNAVDNFKYFCNITLKHRNLPKQTCGCYTTSDAYTGQKVTVAYDDAMLVSLYQHTVVKDEYITDEISWDGYLYLFHSCNEI